VATYVLVPGAWLGGWAWQAVARDLRARGHDVYPVTLTGLGERVHLASPAVDLDTHITDVINLIAFEDLDDVILAGHSYAGAVITSVANSIPDRLAQLVYVDSAPLADGQSMLDLSPPEGRADLERVVAELGEGWRWPLPSFEELAEGASLAGLGEAELALMRGKATPQPFGTYRQPLQLSNTKPGAYQRVFIACDDVRGLVTAGVPQIVPLTQPPWRYEELETGHWPMFSQPRELAALLDWLAKYL
jgi:pimeloyl-ACP methyl ester carboxylesterase